MAGCILPFSTNKDAELPTYMAMIWTSVGDFGLHISRNWSSWPKGTEKIDGACVALRIMVLYAGNRERGKLEVYHTLPRTVLEGYRRKNGTSLQCSQRTTAFISALDENHNTTAGNFRGA